MKDPLKPRDKITQKMTRDGLVEVNETKETAELVSKRIQDAEFGKTPEQQAAQDAAQLQNVSSHAAPLPHVAEHAAKPDTGTAERVMEHIDAAHTRKASKKAVRKAQQEATAKTSSSRLQFTEEELSTPELERYIEKSNKAADRLDAAKAAIPKKKKLTTERTFDEAAGKAKVRLHFEEQEKQPNIKGKKNPLSRPAQEAGIFVHNKIHSVEKDNSGVEGAHKSEEAAEKGAKYGARGYRPCKTSSRQRGRLSLLELVRLQFPRGMVRLFCVLVLRANGLIRAALCRLPVAGYSVVYLSRAMGRAGL